MSLQPVTIYKNDTCLTYALKRIGRFSLYPIDLPDLLVHPDVSVLLFSPTILEVGDLLLNDAEATPQFLPMRIEADGRTTYVKTARLFHVGVYEGEFDGDKIYTDIYFHTAVSPAITRNFLVNGDFNKIVRF